MILVDSNVLIDVLEMDAVWGGWSFRQLEDAAEIGPVAINHVVVAEVAPQFGALDVFLDRMKVMMIGIEPLTDAAAMAAGVAFRAYRARRSGAKSVLPDFLIGGHALTMGATVLTRDPRFYVKYFPDLPLITPETDNG
ncbi:MAG: nucleotide-binding protein [Sphingomonas bacterium]|uniref:type II toxin-antitoxin system VapC family toxin n=1 Tax=Sphingomonas bacterium TaxID=1895847 RepID=UPI00260165B4|nr:type II toxin-antitoxin system VapC family toxin [Sphingomonas bacterium]MDB5711100.1 nucleotide-binding protein [Sphingomonas bacterium]